MTHNNDQNVEKDAFVEHERHIEQLYFDADDFDLEPLQHLPVAEDLDNFVDVPGPRFWDLIREFHVCPEGGQPSFYHGETLTLILDGNKWLRFHFPYYQDLSIHHLTKVAKEIFRIHCITEGHQLKEVHALSAKNPGLADTTSYEQQGVLSRGQSVLLVIAAEWTNCAYQPLFKDIWSLDHDEKTLRLATEFCWRDSFMNLEGVIHGIKKKSQQVHIRAKFKALIDHADKHLTMSMDHDAIGRVLLMGELEKLLAQSGSNIIEEYMDNEHDIRVAPHKTTFAEKIKQAIAAFFVAVILGTQHPWIAWSVVHHAFNSLKMDATMPQTTSSSCLCSVISTNGRVLCGSYRGVGTRNSRIVKT